jgi:hypothetical protein
MANLPPPGRTTVGIGILYVSHPHGKPEMREEIRLLLGINKGVVDQVSVDIDRHLAD